MDFAYLFLGFLDNCGHQSCWLFIRATFLSSGQCKGGACWCSQYQRKCWEEPQTIVYRLHWFASDTLVRISLIHLFDCMPVRKTETIVRLTFCCQYSTCMHSNIPLNQVYAETIMVMHFVKCIDRRTYRPCHVKTRSGEIGPKPDVAIPCSFFVQQVLLLCCAWEKITNEYTISLFILCFNLSFF